MKFKDETDFAKPKSSGPGKDAFLKIVEGKPVVVAFRGDPVDFYQHWTGKYGEVCTRFEPGGCDYCDKGDKGNFRFRINVAVKEGDSWSIKIFENGRKVYNALRAMNTECPLSGNLMKLSRAGDSKENTSYTIMPVMKDGKITPELEARIAKLSLFELVPQKPKAEAAPPKQDPRSFDESDSPDELPF